MASSKENFSITNRATYGSDNIEGVTVANIDVNEDEIELDVSTW